MYDCCDSESIYCDSICYIRPATHAALQIRHPHYHILMSRINSRYIATRYEFEHVNQTHHVDLFSQQIDSARSLVVPWQHLQLQTTADGGQQSHTTVTQRNTNAQQTKRKCDLKKHIFNYMRQPNVNLATNCIIICILWCYANNRQSEANYYHQNYKTEEKNAYTPSRCVILVIRRFSRANVIFWFFGRRIFIV